MATQYTIKSGDTLSKIAAANGTTVADLASLNKIADPNKIYAGQNLTIGGSGTPTITPQAPTGLITGNQSVPTVTNSSTPQFANTQANSSLNTAYGGSSSIPSGAYSNNQTTAFPTALKSANPSVSSAVNTTPVNTSPTAHTVSNVTPLNIPASNVSTASSALGSYTDSSFQNFQNTQNTNKAVSAYQDTVNNAPEPVGNSNTEDLRGRIAETYGIDPKELAAKLSTKSSETSALNDQYQLPQKIQDATDTYNEYQKQKLALQQKIETIRTTPGITQEQAVQQISEITKAGNANLANLSIIAETAQGNLTAAQNTIKMKLDAEFQPIQDQIDALSKFVSINNADLTDSQKTQLENQRFQLQTEMTNLLSAKQSAHQFALQQGIQDPNVLNAIDAAQTPAEVYSAVGGSATGLPGFNTQGNGQPNIAPQYQSYVTQTTGGTSYVGQDKLSNLTPYQQQEAARQYAAAGISVLNADDTSKIRNIDVTKQNLEQMGSVVQNLLGNGSVGRIGSSIANIFASVTQSNPQVAAFNGYRTVAINTLQALGAGSGGARITASEIKTATDNLPTITDSIQTAQAKLGIVNGYLDKWTNQLLPGKSGSGGNGGLYDF